MFKRLLPIALLSLVACQGDSPDPGEATTLLVENVNVVAMDAPRILPEHSVLIEDGRILEVAAQGSIAPPPGALRIDGAGGFLMPGLAEMHAHLPATDDEDGLRDAILTLFVTQGVTLARSMLGADDHPALREEVAARQRFGPRMLVAGPFLSGDLDDPDEARQLVAQLQQDGFDLLKIGEGLQPEVYTALTEEARRLGIPFAGHVPDDVGLFAALEAGQATVDHLDNYVEDLRGDDAPEDFPAIFGADRLLPYFDRERLPEAVAATRDAQTAMVPTMLLWHYFFGGEDFDGLLEAMPERRYLPPSVIENWREALRRIRARIDPELGPELLELRIEILNALHAGGVYVLLGSDAPQVLNVPGFSVHREMVYLQDEVGLPPFEVLFSATRAVAEHLGAEEDFGTIQPGRRADLILLRDNPLEDVHHVSSIEGVILAGRWHSRADLDSRLEALAQRYDNH